MAIQFAIVTTARFRRWNWGSSCCEALLAVGVCDKVYEELFLWIRADELVGCYDQHNLGGNASVERVARVIQSFVDHQSSCSRLHREQHAKASCSIQTSTVVGRASLFFVCGSEAKAKAGRRRKEQRTLHPLGSCRQRRHKLFPRGPVSVGRTVSCPLPSRHAGGDLVKFRDAIP